MAFRELATGGILPAGIRLSVSFIPTTSGALDLAGVASIAPSFPRLITTWNRDSLPTRSGQALNLTDHVVGLIPHSFNARCGRFLHGYPTPRPARSEAMKLSR